MYVFTRYLDSSKNPISSIMTRDPRANTYVALQLHHLIQLQIDVAALRRKGGENRRVSVTRIRAVEGHANVEHFHIHSNMATMMTIAMAMPAGAPRATATSSSGVTGERRNQPSPSLLGEKEPVDWTVRRHGAEPARKDDASVEAVGTVS